MAASAAGRCWPERRSWALPAGSLAMVLAAIGSTTFDGAQEGALKEPIASTFQWMTDSGLSPIAALRLTNSLFLLATLLAVAAIFWGGIYGMRIVDGKRRAMELARKFAHAFIPIALAYLVAHYFSLFVYQEQAQFSFLLSDPFGDGSELLRHGGLGNRLLARRRDGHLVRAVRRDRRRARDRAGARPRPRAGALEGPTRRRLVAGLDAGDDGVLQRPRPLPALAGERLTCSALLPIAHAGHWLPYVVPALVVLVAVVVSTVRERRRRAEAGD